MKPYLICMHMNYHARDDILCQSPMSIELLSEMSTHMHIDTASSKFIAQVPAYLDCPLSSIPSHHRQFSSEIPGALSMRLLTHLQPATKLSCQVTSNDHTDWSPLRRDLCSKGQCHPFWLMEGVAHRTVRISIWVMRTSTLQPIMGPNGFETFSDWWRAIVWWMLTVMIVITRLLCATEVILTGC